MSKLNRAAFEQKRLKTIDIEIEELGGSVTLREMSASQVGDFLKKLAELKKDHTEEAERTAALLRLNIEAVIACAIDENGNKLFFDGDVEMIRDNLPHHVAQRLTTETLKHSKLLQDDKEEIEKNSETAPSTDSASD